MQELVGKTANVDMELELFAVPGDSDTEKELPKTANDAFEQMRSDAGKAERE